MSKVKHINSMESTRDRMSKLIPLAGNLYNIIPLRLRWVASPLIYCYQLFLSLRLKVWLVTGDELNSRMPLSILCAANDDKALNYLLGLAFGSSFRERYLGRAWLWKIRKVIAERRQGCSLVIVQVLKSQRKLFGSSNWFYIPNWVVGEVDIPSDPTVTKDSSLKSDLRRIRKNSLQFEVIRDSRRFDDFYHNMYVPHVIQAHSSSAFILPHKEMRKGFKNCDLLLVTKQEKSIAGILIEYEKKGPHLWSLGIRDSNPEYIRDGAVGALFLFSLVYLKEKGFTKVNFGLSRAFLRDGVLQYKGKWSQRIIGTSSYGFALNALSYTAGVKAFLQNNPFIFESSGILHSAVFVDGEKPLTPNEIKKIDKHHFHPGLSKLFIYHLMHGDAVKQGSVPPELSERIVLRSVENKTSKV